MQPEKNYLLIIIKTEYYINLSPVNIIISIKYFFADNNGLSQEADN